MRLMTFSDVPRERGWLDVGAGRQIYWEEEGHSEGLPAVYLHGGRRWIAHQ